MKLLTDEILHLYINNPEELDKEIKSEIKKELETSGKLRERIEKIRNYYTEYKKLEQLETKYIPLQTMFVPEENGFKYTKLAASTESQVDEYKYVKTFASAKSLVLIRLLYNSVKDNYLLYLISDNMNDVSGAKVIFPEINFETTADKEGIVHISGINFEGIDNVLVESKNENL